MFPLICYPFQISFFFVFLFSNCQSAHLNIHRCNTYFPSFLTVCSRVLFCSRLLSFALLTYVFSLNIIFT
uniref:Secreted protein n=1 Tax=Octopus bimaculoides TaxID=37653 RepID=A0A0L8HPY8_OCTBM